MAEILASGAEAVISRSGEHVIKKRIVKSYREKSIDEKIRKLRTRGEAKILTKMAQVISVPKVISSSEELAEIKMEFIEGDKLSLKLDSFKLDKKKEICFLIGEGVGKMHETHVVHGDLTTSNMILKKGKVYFIDFGLSFQNGKYEDKAVDLHLLRQALEAKHFTHWEDLFKSVEEGYLSVDKIEGKKVLERFKAVEKRGRYKH